MNTMVDEPNSSVDPETEVKKLQDLVKKLEQQNQILRSKQNQNQTDLGKDLDKKSVSKQNLTNSQETDHLKDDLENILLDDDDLINIDESINGDDENWLYSSPKRPTPEQKSLSPYKWVRKEFDNPSPEVESAKKSLLFRLDLVGGTRVDTGTFTRPKKNRQARASAVEQNGTSDESDKLSTKDELDLGHNKLEDVVDVRVLARMQEESLRQSFTPLSSPRRSIDGCNNQIRRSNNSLASNSSHSTASSPPDSPYGSQYLEQSRQTDHRRSLPNLARGLNASLQPHNYENKQATPNSRMLRPRSAQGQSEHTKPRTGVPAKSGLASPKSRLTPTTNNHLRATSPTRGHSPQRSGIPAPRSSIPRPGSAGTRRSIPTPTRKSGLAKPSRLGSALSPDDSWKEGCF